MAAMDLKPLRPMRQLCLRAQAVAAVARILAFPAMARTQRPALAARGVTASLWIGLPCPEDWVAVAVALELSPARAAKVAALPELQRVHLLRPHGRAVLVALGEVLLLGLVPPDSCSL